jgi:methionyl-tRNA synthetase
VTNWYFKLEDFQMLLQEWVDYLKQLPNTRPMLTNILQEFLKPPVIYVKKEFQEEVDALRGQLPNFKIEEEEKKTSFEMVFDNLEDREKACGLLAENNIRYRTGKTLVPFRLTGNVEWGVPAPEKEGIGGLTFWVWPESLWAPISFTKTYLEQQEMGEQDWKKWWCSPDTQVYQFIGEDNIYFYGLAEMAMFLAFQGSNPTIHPGEGQMQLPNLIANSHVLFLDKKASSSGKVKPPMASELLNYYTAEQLRAHFLGLGLGIRSVSFQPKPLNPKANERDGDPALKEGNLLTNVLNRLARSCFYTSQQYYDGKVPVGQVSESVLQEARDTILEYEKLMYKYEFHNVMNLMDTYIRNANKYWVSGMIHSDCFDDQSDHLRPDMNAFPIVDYFTIDVVAKHNRFIESALPGACPSAGRNPAAGCIHDMGANGCSVVYSPENIFRGCLRVPHGDWYACSMDIGYKFSCSFNLRCYGPHGDDVPRLFQIALVFSFINRTNGFCMSAVFGVQKRPFKMNAHDIAGLIFFHGTSNLLHCLNCSIFTYIVKNGAVD